MIFLYYSFNQAEARLAAKRQARAEAREIRMRELDRQQKELEQNADRAYDMQQSSNMDTISTPRSRLTANNSAVGIRGTSMSSRRSSEDSLEEEGRSLRDLRHELKVSNGISMSSSKLFTNSVLFTFLGCGRKIPKSYDNKCSTR